MNEKKITIRIKIADRYYPITIVHSEEETFRAISKQINDLILQLSQRYVGYDMQDFMALALLQISMMKQRNMGSEKEKELIIKKLEQLDKVLEDFLVEEQVL